MPSMQLEPRLSHLFRRCVKCPSDIPVCPECPAGQTCSLNAESCDACASATCIEVESQSAKDGDNGTSKSTTPAIAGGVAGGVLFIIVVTFLVWWFFIRNRRRELDDQTWPETDESVHGIEKRDQKGLHADARESTRSMGSIASTVRTRASNVIQIAYIPGVTNRSPTHSPGILQPPVPPVPIPSVSGSDDVSPTSDTRRRSPISAGGLDFPGADTRPRQSLSPSLARSSTATFYPAHAELSARPAQQALRGRAAMVTVNKSGNATPPDSDSPADSTGSPTLANAAKGIMTSPIVARNVTARPIEVKRSNSGKKNKLPAESNVQATAANSQIDPVSSQPSERPDPESVSSEKQAESAAGPELDDISTRKKQSQYTDVSSVSSVSELAAARPPPLHLNVPLTSRFSFSPPSTAATNSASRQQPNDGIHSMIEQATSRAARAPSHGGLGGVADKDAQAPNHPTAPRHRENRTQGGSDSASFSGPFSDANEVREGDSQSGSGSRGS